MNQISPVDFAKLSFDWFPFEYQIKPLNDMSQRVLMATGRQVGKTEIAALKGLYHAFTIPNSTVLILAPVQRQAQILFRRIKFFLNKNASMPSDERLPIYKMVSRETQTVIETDHGSELHALPLAEDAENVRGYTADLVIIDECAEVSEEAMSAISPMLIARKGKLMLISTPRGTNNFFARVFKSPLEYGFKTYSFPSTVRFHESELKGERKRMPDLQFRQEYLAEFVESSGAMFTESEINKIMSGDCPYREQPLGQYEYYLGYDPSRFGEDEAYGVIIEKRPEREDKFNVRFKYAMVNSFFFKKSDMPQQIQAIKEWHRNFKFKKILIDTTGMGSGVIDPLYNEGLPVEGYEFTIKSKQEAYFHLKRMIESQEIILPPEQKLKKQMLDLRREQQPGTQFTKIFPPRHVRDDYITALVLAAYASSKKKMEIAFGVASKPFFG